MSDFSSDIRRVQERMNNLSITAHPDFIVAGHYSTGFSVEKKRTTAALSTGACCFPDGSCSIKTFIDCTNAGGSYQGNGTPCTPNPCPPPLCPDPDAETITLILSDIIICDTLCCGAQCCPGNTDPFIDPNGTWTLTREDSGLWVGTLDGNFFAQVQCVGDIMNVFVADNTISCDYFIGEGPPNTLSNGFTDCPICPDPCTPSPCDSFDHRGAGGTASIS